MQSLGSHPQQSLPNYDSSKPFLWPNLIILLGPLIGEQDLLCLILYSLSSHWKQRTKTDISKQLKHTRQTSTQEPQIHKSYSHFMLSSISPFKQPSTLIKAFTTMEWNIHIYIYYTIYNWNHVGQHSMSPTRANKD